MAESRSKSRYRRAIAEGGGKKGHKRRQGRPVPALSPPDLGISLATRGKRRGGGESSLINPAVRFPLPRCVTSVTRWHSTMAQLWMTMLLPASVPPFQKLYYHRVERGFSFFRSCRWNKSGGFWDTIKSRFTLRRMYRYIVKIIYHNELLIIICCKDINDGWMKL